MPKLQYEVYLRSPEFERAAGDMRMRPVDWELLLALDGHAVLGDLAERLHLDVDEAVETMALCERLGIVDRRRVTLTEYRAGNLERPEAPAPQASAQAPAVLETDAPDAPDAPEPSAAAATLESEHPAAAEPAPEAQRFEELAAPDEAPFPALVTERPIADLPLTISEPESAEPESAEPAVSAAEAPGSGLPELEPEQLAGASAKPIEFKLRPSVQVLIR
jgi:hypothetical protein